MKTFNFQKGKAGETLAKNFLTKKGYQIVKSNFQNRFGEIDLVATKDKILVFIEVKLKIGEQFGLPEEMITPTKIRQIEQTAQVFLQQNSSLASQYPQYRIDAVCIVLDENQNVERIKHYENISPL